MKKWLCSLLLCCLGLAFCACGATEFSVTEIAGALAEQVSFTDSLVPLDAKDTMDLYGLSTEEVKDCVAYVGSGATAEEISVWEATSADNAAVVEEKVKERVETQKEGYGDYKPAEVPKLENCVLKTNGVYVVLCVCDNSDAAQAVLDDFSF